MQAPVILYARVSTEEQAKEGYSVEAQEKVLRAYCVVKNYQNIEFYADAGYSAKNINRPGIQKVLERIKQGGVEALLVWRLDRLSRSLKDTLHMLEDIIMPAGTQIISTSENIETATPAGRLMLNILASFAQAERENTQERIRMVSGELAKTGHHMGGVPPFGYQVVNNHYQLVRPACEAVRRIFEMFIDGDGYTAIINHLKQGGFKTTRGNDFTKGSIHDILKNEKYTGVYIWNRTVSADKNGTRNNRASKPNQDIVRIPGAIPPIITHEMWQKAQDILKANQKIGRRNTAKETYLLTGIIQCAECGRQLHIHSGSKDRDGTKQRYYACPNRCCRSARKEEVEGIVLLTIMEYLSREDIIRAAIQAANNFAETAGTEDLPEIEKIDQSIYDTKLQLDQITQFISHNGTQAPATLMDKMRCLESAITNLENERAGIRQSHKKINPDKIIENLKKILYIKNYPPNEQRQLIRQAVSSISVSDSTYRCILNCQVDGGGEPYHALLQSITNRINKIKGAIYNIRVTSDINVINYKKTGVSTYKMQKQKIVTLLITQITL